MRPINSMIEFKQIIGRGTRLYDGKDYFTIYDFVKAHHHFSDPEWDGEPLEPGTCDMRQYPCVCEAAAPEPCPECGQQPMRVSEGTVRGSAANSRACAEERQGQGEARRRQGAHHPAHDGDDASGIPTARRCPRSSSWRCCSASCPSSSRTRTNCAPSGARRTRARSYCRAGREGLRSRAAGRDAEDHRRGEERPLRRAGLRRLRAAAGDPRGTRGARPRSPSARTSTPSSRRSSTSCSRTTSASAWRNSTGEADAAAAPEIPHSIADAVADLGTAPEVRRAFIGFQRWLYTDAADIDASGPAVR